MWEIYVQGNTSENYEVEIETKKLFKKMWKIGRIRANICAIEDTKWAKKKIIGTEQIFTTVCQKKSFLKWNQSQIYY